MYLIDNEGLTGNVPEPPKKPETAELFWYGFFLLLLYVAYLITAVVDVIFFRRRPQHINVDLDRGAMKGARFVPPT